MKKLFAARTSVRKSITSLLAVLWCILFVSVVSATAQDKARLEVYGGYSILRPNLPDTVQGEDTKILQSAVGTMLGWSGGVTANITDRFGITGDVSGYYRKVEGVDLDGSSGKASVSIHSFLVGPRISGSGEKVRPFAHALFGIGRINGSASLDSDESSFTNTGFAMAFGAGLDVVVTERVSVRPIQFDFFPTRQKNADLGISSITLKNIRFGTGVVFHFR